MNIKKSERQEELRLKNEQNTEVLREFASTVDFTTIEFANMMGTDRPNMFRILKGEKYVLTSTLKKYLANFDKSLVIKKIELQKQIEKIDSHVDVVSLYRSKLK